MRFEAKNGFFKQKRWYNFKNLPKSLSEFHQKYLCLHMIDERGSKLTDFSSCETVLSGIDVVPLTQYPDLSNAVNLAIGEVKVASKVIHKNIEYDLGDVLVIEFTGHDFPKFGVIHAIVSIDEKILLGLKSLAAEFYDEKVNAFAVSLSENAAVSFIDISNLFYEWPQIKHNVGTVMYVMLKNIDEAWGM